MKALLVALGFGRPPDGVTAKEICAKVYTKVNELLKGLSPNYLGRPLIRTNMSEKQWNQIHRINQILFDEYKTRRELLLKRLDVTVQSFKWAERLKVIFNVFIEFYLYVEYFRIKMMRFQMFSWKNEKLYQRNQM